MKTLPTLLTTQIRKNIILTPGNGRQAFQLQPQEGKPRALFHTLTHFFYLEE